MILLHNHVEKTNNAQRIKGNRQGQAGSLVPYPCGEIAVDVLQASAGADVHRARFHSSMIDTKMLKARQEFKEIHDSYVIFITASDVLGAGCPLYHVKRMIEETGTYFGDGSHIIYLSGSYKDDNA